MRRLLAVVPILAVVACSGGGSDDPPPPTGGITLSNQSGASIDEVYIALPTDEVWGARRNGSVVPYQFSFTQPGLTPTDWHVQAVSYGESTNFYAFALFVPVVEGQNTGVTLYYDDFSGTLGVVNADSLADISALWVKPSADPVDAFQSIGLASPLSWGSEFKIVALTAGSWDVWCDFDDGSDDAVYGVQISPFSYGTVSCGN